MLKQVSSYSPSGKHDRPEAKVELVKLVADLAAEDVFTFTPGRFFSAHPAFPRDMLLWLNRPRYMEWIDENIVDLGKRQESGKALKSRRKTFAPSP